MIPTCYDESKAGLKAFNVVQAIANEADNGLRLSYEGETRVDVAEQERRLLACLDGQDPDALYLSALGQSMIDQASGGRVRPAQPPALKDAGFPAEHVPTDEEVSALCREYMAALDEKGRLENGTAPNGSSLNAAVSRVNDLSNRLRGALRTRAAYGRPINLPNGAPGEISGLTKKMIDMANGKPLPAADIARNPIRRG